MNITLTITGDAISPEIAQMLQALGVALSGEKAILQAEHEPKIEPEIEKIEEVPTEVAAPVKKTRKRKTAESEPVAAEEEETTPVEETSPEAEADQTVTLESLREQVIFLAKSGKSDDVKVAFQEVGAAKLGDVKKEDYSLLHDILAAI